MSLILILLFFFAKVNEMEDGNINHLIGGIKIFFS